MKVRVKALLGGIVMVSSLACYAQATTDTTAASGAAAASAAPVASGAQAAPAKAPATARSSKKADRAANRALSKKVYKAITKAPGIGNAEVTVFAQAKTGAVTLAGYVTDESQDKVAQDAARQVPGVKSVTSKLRLRMEGGGQ